MLKSKALWLVAMVTLAAGFGTTSLKADILGVDIVSTDNFGASVWNLGWSFTVNSATVVTGLGNYDNGSLSTLPQPQQVGLWDSSGNLLASAFVTSSSTQIGNWFAFTAITPVALTVGDTYIVGGQGGEIYAGEVPITVAPQITFQQSLFTFLGTSSNSPLVEPGTSDGFDSTSDAAWFGGNVLLSSTATPEPGFYGMLALGFSGMVVALKRRRA